MSAANASVSSTSRAAPDGWPWIGLPSCRSEPEVESRFELDWVPAVGGAGTVAPCQFSKAGGKTQVERGIVVAHGDRLAANVFEDCVNWVADRPVNVPASPRECLLTQFDSAGVAGDERREHLATGVAWDSAVQRLG